MSADSTKELLENYHDASKRLEARWKVEMQTADNKRKHHHLTTGARELVSRCILSDNPHSLLFLLCELEILLRVLGQPRAAHLLNTITKCLAIHYRDNGSF